MYFHQLRDLYELEESIRKAAEEAKEKESKNDS